MTRTRRIVAANIKKFREEKRLSVVQAAERLGVGRQYWYLMENGGGNLPLDRLDAVASVLGVSVPDLLHEGNGRKGDKRELVGGKKR